MGLDGGAGQNEEGLCERSPRETAGGVGSRNPHDMGALAALQGAGPVGLGGAGGRQAVEAGRHP